MNSFNLNILTDRPDYFKNCFLSNSAVSFNKDLELGKLTVVDYFYYNTVDPELLKGNLLFFTEKLGGDFSDELLIKLKPDSFVSCSLSDLCERLEQRANFQDGNNFEGFKKVLSFDVKNTDQLKDILNKVSSLNFTSQNLRERFTLVMDELSSNTLYNAPTDKFGNPLFRKVLRSQKVELEGEQSVLVEVYESSDAFMIYCKDEYGSLFADTVKNFIFRKFVNIRRDGGGAGIGLSYVFNHCNSLYYQISIEKKTEVFARLLKVKRIKEFSESYKEFYIKEEGFLEL
jgi:hypothetical protein